MSTPRKYRKKPVVIEAMPFTGDNLADCLVWALGTEREAAERCQEMGLPLFIPTLEGEMKANPGDFIIRGVAGEFYPCKPDIFAATYEAVDE
jgi:hypothetical protein